MGTHTEFTGAIRITPQIKEPLSSRFTEWLELTHMRRNVSVLEDLYPTEAERKAHTLFGDGDFGKEGELYIPNLSRRTGSEYVEDEMISEGVEDDCGIYSPPGDCPDSYSDLVLAHSEDGKCSYIGWNEAEKSYGIPEWLMLIAGYLVPRGYHLDGTMFACVEYGSEYYFVIVDDANVAVKEFEPETTYQREFSDSLYRSTQRVASCSMTAPVFQGSWLENTEL